MHLKSWLIWLIAAVFYGYQFGLRVAPSVMTNELMVDLNASAKELGTISSMYYYSYSLMQIPLGMLIDRFGVRRLLSIMALTCASGVLIFSMADTIWTASLGRLVMGAGAASAFIGCMKIATAYLPPNQLGLATGLTMVVGTGGGIVASPFLATLVADIGWQDTLYGVGVIGTILAVLIWFGVQDRQLPKENLTLDTRPQEKLSSLISQPNFWFLTLWCAMLHGPTIAFADLWGNAFFMSVYQLPCETVAQVSSFLFTGLAIGSLAFAALTDSLKRRKLPIIIGGLGICVTFLLVVYGSPKALWLMKLNVFFLGFFAASKLLAFASIGDFAPLNLSATAIGAANTICMLFGAVLQPVVGTLMERQRNIHGGGFMPADFHLAFGCVAGAVILAAILGFLVKETFGKAKA